MSEPPPVARNGNGRGGIIVSSIAALGISRLTPELLMLLLINTAFIASVFWFLDRQTTARERVLLPIITACMAHYSDEPRNSP